MAFDSVWLNGQVATMRSGGGAYGEVPDGAVAVTGGKIEWVGRRTWIGANPFRSVIKEGVVVGP